MVADARRAVLQLVGRARGSLEKVKAAMEAFDGHLSDVGRELDAFDLDRHTRDTLGEVLCIATSMRCLDAELQELVDLIEDARDAEAR